VVVWLPRSRCRRAATRAALAARGTSARGCGDAPSDGAIGHYVRGVLALERRDPIPRRRRARQRGAARPSFYGDPWLTPLTPIRASPTDPRHT
jgi:hypothetical protein